MNKSAGKNFNREIEVGAEFLVANQNGEDNHLIEKIN